MAIMLICFLLFGSAIGTLIGAVTLRAVISLYNKFVGGRGSPNSVPEPGFGKAMGIIFITTLINIGPSLGIGLVMRAIGVVAGVDERVALIIAQLIALPVSLMVMTLMVMALLPTTFGRALLVVLCYFLVVLMALIVIAAVVLIVVLGVRLFAH